MIMRIIILQEFVIKVQVIYGNRRIIHSFEGNYLVFRVLVFEVIGLSLTGKLRQ